MRRSIYLGLALLVLGVGVVGAWVVMQGNQRKAQVLTSKTSPLLARAKSAHEGLAPPNGLPFYGAVSTTIQAAEVTLNAHVPRPSASSASDASITKVWINALTGQVAIDYSSGMKVLATQNAAPADPASAAAAVVAEMGGLSSQTTIEGYPAVVTQGNTPGNCSSQPAPSSAGAIGCAPAQQNPTDLAFAINGWALEIYGPGTFSVNDIESIGSTVS